MQETTRKALELFVEKAHTLKSFRFTRFIESQEMRLEISGNGETILKVEQQFPEEEDVRGFANSLRVFLQKDDRISFPWLAQHVLVDSEISEDWKREFIAAREALNQYLDSFPRRLIIINGTTKTRRQIMDVFLRGDISHLDPKYRPTFENWRDDPLAFPIQQMEFYEIMRDVLLHIEHVLCWTEQELQA